MVEIGRSVDQAIGPVESGALVALGDAHRMEPIALAGGLIRAGARDLRLVTGPTGGLAVDLIIAAGLAAQVETAQVSLGEFGLAPAFRKAVEGGRLAVLEAA